MSRFVPRAIDVTDIWQQFCTDLAQMQSLDAAVIRCAAFLDSCFTPRLSQIVWREGVDVRLLHSSIDRAIVLPGAGEMHRLARHELAFCAVEEHVSRCFAPILVRGILSGWLCIEEPIWGEDGPGMLGAVAAQAGPWFALLYAIDQQERHLAQHQTINDIGRLLSGVLDLDRLLETIYAAARQIVDAPNFCIALYNEATNHLELAYVVREWELKTIEERWVPNTGLTSVIVQNHQPLCTDDYIAECQRRNITPRLIGPFPPSRAWLGFPMLAHERLIGIIVISSYEERQPYSNDHVELLTAIAAQAAVAIENAHLYQRSEHQARQLATLNRIGRTITSSLDPERVPLLIIEHVASLMDAEEGSLLLVDEASGDLIFSYTTGPVGRQLLGQRIPRGSGLAGYVVSQGTSVIVNDAQQDNRFDSTTDRTTGFITRSLLAVPLRGVGGVQGVIEVINRRSDRPFTPEDQQLLEMIADQALIALENARRFSQIDQALARRAQELAQTNDMLQHSLRSLTALNALGMAINSSLRSPDEIFALTARGVIEMTLALGAAVVREGSDGFRSVVHIGPAQSFAEAIASLLQGVIESGRPDMMLMDLPDTLREIGAGALLVVPLRATQHTMGCLCVYYGSTIPGAPDQETVVLFATQAAVAVESIELFQEVRGGRDQMASILASTREGILLIGANGSVAVANDALFQLCGLAPQSLREASVEQFLAAWDQEAGYARDEWQSLLQGLTRIISGGAQFVSGELNESNTCPHAIEWAALAVQGSAESSGGALLVLRDITEAKESERLRQDLTNMIVHDLRSPLSSVMASIDMLVKGISGPLVSTQRDVLNIAYSSSQQMLEMINTLLDISRLEAGRMPLNLQDCDLQVLCERAIDQLSALAREHSMLIQSDIAEHLPKVRADGEAISRVLQNLLANALKFSGQNSTILVRAFEPDPTQTNGFVTVAVSDCGVGIAPKDREKIFAKFGQVGERRGGTGLGLTFCKLVIETHGGTIWVESALGSGSTFYFTLPIAKYLDTAM